MMTNHFFKTLVVCMAAAVSVSLGSCAADRTDSIAEPAVESTATESPFVISPNGEITLRTDCAGTDVHWEYEGNDGPAYWADLCTDWACGGTQQSPVNIIPPPVRRLSKSLRFYWKNTVVCAVKMRTVFGYKVVFPG